MEVVSTDSRCPLRGCKSNQVVNHAISMMTATGEKVTAVSIGPGHHTLVVDTDDYTSKIGKKTWSFAKYAYCSDEQLYAHRVILGEPATACASVDHIDRQPLDNRKANLRWATQSEQNSNLGCRADKIAPPDDIYALGIPELPRYMRFDEKEAKFTFTGHPFVAALAGKGVVVNSSGTKAKANSQMQKLKDALLKLRDMYATYRVHFPADDEFCVDRIRLAKEYNDIVSFAHKTDPANFPNGPYADLDGLMSDSQQTSIMLGKLSDVDDPVSGPQNHARHDVATHDVAVRRCEGVVTMFDAKHAGALQDVKWDVSDMRVHISPKILAAFPTIATIFPGKKKIFLSELIFHVLEHRPILPGHCIVPYNQIKNDVRMENLQLLPGEAKNYKRPATFVPIEGYDIGAEYLPKGVVMSVDRGIAMFVVKCAGVMKKFGVNSAADARGVFTNKVVPLLTAADPDFAENNAKYQRLLHTYMHACVPNML